MKRISKKSSLFAVAITVSLIMHSFLIAGLSGIKGVIFLKALSSRIILTGIVSEPKRGVYKSKSAAVRPLNKGLNYGGPVPTSKIIASVPAASQGKIKGGSSKELNGIESGGNAGDGETTDNGENRQEVDEGTDEFADRADFSLQSVLLGDTTLLGRNIKESFSYDIYWVGIYVGNALFEVLIDNGMVKMTSQAHSASFISKFYEVEDYAESTVVNGLPANFRIRQHEGKYRSDKETVFNSGNNKIIFFNYLNNTRDEHTVDKTMWDVISGFYYLRGRPLEPGKTVFVDVFDSNKFLKVGVDVLRKERIKSPGAGEINAVVVKLLLRSEGLFQSKGDILIWLSDDNRKIPLRVETKVPLGNVVAELKSMESAR